MGLLTVEAYREKIKALEFLYQAWEVLKESPTTRRNLENLMRVWAEQLCEELHKLACAAEPFVSDKGYTNTRYEVERIYTALGRVAHAHPGRPQETITAISDLGYTINGLTKALAALALEKADPDPDQEPESADPLPQ